ncbi:hypothetical protein ACLSU7_00465 [Bdellovibrio sp. HCB185ZH]|uniref:hypothetical protein n=1 Tax=Bdellovibrio sp. HCB185ZH TaxID=3394235 RepID=UPI0039A7353D
MRKKSLSLYIKNFALLATTVMVFLGTSSAFAAPNDTPPDDKTTLEEDLINSNIYISRFFDNMADGVDLFLAGQQYTEKPNTTSAVFETASYYNSLEGLRNDLSFDFYLRLPNVEEYWQVTFTSYDETAERGVSQEYLRNQPRQRNAGATFGFFRQLGNVRTSYQPRISFALPLKISHTLTFESIVEKSKSYRVNPKLQFYADADKGTGMFQALNFNFTLNRRFSLTFINEGDYEDRIATYTVTNGVALGQWFSKMANISYNIFFTSKNRPNYHLYSYNFSAAFSQILYKNILDYQIQPNIDFSEEHDFVRNPGVNFHLYIRF